MRKVIALCFCSVFIAILPGVCPTGTLAKPEMKQANFSSIDTYIES